MGCQREISEITAKGREPNAFVIVKFPLRFNTGSHTPLDSLVIRNCLGVSLQEFTAPFEQSYYQEINGRWLVVEQIMFVMGIDTQGLSFIGRKNIEWHNRC